MVSDKSPGAIDDLVLRSVFEATARQNASLESFFDELMRFQRLSERQNKSTVSKAAIRQWRDGKSKPRRGAAAEFLVRFIHWISSSRDSSYWEGENEEKRDRALRLLEPMQPAQEDIPGKRNIPGISKELPETIDTAIVIAFQTLLSISKKAPYSEEEAFFRGARPDENDASYYACFRYSTNYGAVVKSFIVVRKPIIERRNTYIFTEFLGGGAGPTFIDHLYRESEGVVLKMEKSFYFVGASHNVPADKKFDPDLYAKMRRDAKWKPNGLSMFAFEYDDIKLSPGLFGGLVMTVADVAQPIVSRVALLHLGVKSVLRVNLSDDVVRPGEIEIDEIEKDLEKTVDEIQRMGGVRLGHQLEKAVRQNPETRVLKQVADGIKKMIDNLPAWEREKGEGYGSKQKGSIARGAIETFGNGRPRN